MLLPDSLPANVPLWTGVFPARDRKHPKEDRRLQREFGKYIDRYWAVAQDEAATVRRPHSLAFLLDILH